MCLTLLFLILTFLCLPKNQMSKDDWQMTASKNHFQHFNQKCLITFASQMRQSDHRMTFVSFFCARVLGGSRFIGIRGPSAIESKAESLLDAPHVWIFSQKKSGLSLCFDDLFFSSDGVKETTHSNVKN